MNTLKKLIDVNNAIEENIDKINDKELVSINVLNMLRNLVEAIFHVIYEKIEGKNFYGTIEDSKKSIKFCKEKSKYRIIWKFHDLLQHSVSHSTFDKDDSRRLMTKYLLYLIDIKEFVNEKIGIKILRNINKFNFEKNSDLQNYYLVIFNEINRNIKTNNDGINLLKFYIHKVKPIAVKDSIFYELTTSNCNDYRSKFERIIIFSKFKIDTNYAVKIHFKKVRINFNNSEIDINIVLDWEIAIRQCEITNFANLLGEIRIGRNNREYDLTMNFLTDNFMSLLDIVNLNEKEYKLVYEKVHENQKISDELFRILEKCRKILMSENLYSNVLRYLLHTMENKILKKQFSIEKIGEHNLQINYGCRPFDRMPFCSSLIGHNPKLINVLESIPSDGRDHEFLAKKIQYKTEEESTIYTKIEDLSNFKNIKELVNIYNRNLYSKHEKRRMEIRNNRLFILGYELDTINIILAIQKMTNRNNEWYDNFYKKWIKKYLKLNKFSLLQKDIIKKMFITSNFAAIYGSAGTGKTTLLSHVYDLFIDYKIAFVTNTHSALENLHSKIFDDSRNMTSKISLKTIYEYTKTNDIFDLLIIDEASMVSNGDMSKILDKKNFEYLIIVGDTHQIESINFGNWFNLLKKFLPQNCYILDDQFRTNNIKLIDLWKSVRERSDNITEKLISMNACKNLDYLTSESEFEDKIILCFNYDGFYGINNINRILQNKNQNEGIQWGLWIYKIGDPILFNETGRFNGIICNNMKGQIVAIKKSEYNIIFSIKIWKIIDKTNDLSNDLKIVEIRENYSVVEFEVVKEGDLDYDNSNKKAIVPFQVSYAISIHKSQGLEYDSVRVIIIDENEMNITHNIFYTAITRAKKELYILWNAEMQNKIINSFQNIKKNDDYSIIKEIIKENNI